MSQRWVNDSGTARLIKQRWLNDSGVARQIKERWVNDNGVARRTYLYRAPEIGSITAGSNGVAYGFQRSGYGSISGFPQTSGRLSDLALITRCIDVGVGLSTDFQLIIDGASGGFLPPANYFQSIIAHGQTRLASDASYGTSGTIAVWTWAGGQVGWWRDAGTPYTVTLNF